MRTNEERIAAMHKRAAEIEREDKNRKVLIMQGASVVVGLAAVIVLAFIMPGMAGSLAVESATSAARASIFSANNSLGYIVIAVIAFLFGISVAVFCFRLKKWRDENGDAEEK